MKIRSVIFDLGGVFFPWPTAEFFDSWERRLQLPSGALAVGLWHGPDVEAANVGAIAAEEYFRRCGARLGVDELLIGELIESAFAGQSVDEELVRYASELRCRVRLAALTNTWSFGRRLLERRGLGPLFDCYISSAEVGVCKPAPEIFRIALERVAVAPEQVIFVDDSEENLKAARRLGIRGVRFRSTPQAIRDLEDLLS